MTGKGINQIDFAIAASVLIVLFVFTVSHVSGYYSTPMQVVDSAEMRSHAMLLWETAFRNEGVPPSWHWGPETTRPSMGGRLWRVPVHLEEYGENGGSYTLKVPINPGKTHGLPNAWEGSVKVYDGKEAIPTNVTDVEGDGFMESFNVVFEVEMDAPEKTVNVYYSQNNRTNAVYEDLEPEEESDVNITVLSEREERSVSEYKANLTGAMRTHDIAEKYDFGYGFKLYFEVDGDEFSKGGPVYEDAATEQYSRKVLYQNRTGHIKTIEPVVTVW